MIEEFKRGGATQSALATPNDLGREVARELSIALKLMLADIFALYIKTKNFHWHMSGAHFRDYHLMLDEQADELFAMTDPLAERVRKLGDTTVRSIGHIARAQRIPDNDSAYVAPNRMIAELGVDNQFIASHLRTLRILADRLGDIATASSLDAWIDETERRTWFLFEASRFRIE